MGRILLIEDDENHRELFASVLGEEGHEVIACAGGREGLAAIEAVAPDLVILDINMPDIDGVEVLGSLTSEWGSVPVILHSAYSSYANNYRTWSADAFVVKSSNMAPLKRAVKAVLASHSEVA